ncbi:MAG: cellulase family glycosylhydrolase, partial [Oscillospiraceae bacterium]|nr:cellulase family glycosylhydrolase [Oscillospiraceae bacterium]
MFRKFLSFLLTVLLIAGLSGVAAVQGAPGSLATYSFSSPGWATFGIVLPQGKAFDGLIIGSLATQADVKNRWPDGSIRYAILTAHIENTGSYEIFGSAKAGGSLTPAIPDAVLTLNIESYGIGSPIQEYVSSLPKSVSEDLWLDGQLVKEWRVRDIPKHDGVEHSFLSNIWDVRVYSDGTGTVDATVENVRDCEEADGVVYSVDITVDGNNVFHHDRSKPGPNLIYSTDNWTEYTIAASGLKKGNYIRLTSGPAAGKIGVVGGDPFNDKFTLYPMFPDPWEQDGETWELVLYHQYGARWRRVLPLNDFQQAEVQTDFAPFIEAKAIPAYLPDIRTSLTARGRGVWEGTDILGFSIMMPSVGAGGHWAERGLYPEWAANYIAHGTQDLKTLTLDLGELSGSYALHYTKDDPASIVTLDENPFYMPFEYAFPGDKPKNNMRGAGVRFKNSHGQSMAYIPYLVSGDRYFSDEMMFHADFAVMSTYAYTYDTDFPRNGTDGLLWNNEMRGVAWALRDVADAAYYLPDDSPYKVYFANIMNKNLETFDEYMLNLNSPLGFVGFGNYFDQGGSFGAPWQYAYLAWSLDRAIEQNETAAGSFMRNRLLNTLLEPITGAPGFPPEYTAGYWIRYGDVSDTRNIQYYGTWKQVFDANYRDEQGAAQPPAWWAYGYAPEMRLAMIIAKKAGLPGAKEAYDYVMTMDDGVPGLLMRVLLTERSAYAIADFEITEPPEPPDGPGRAIIRNNTVYTAWGTPIRGITNSWIGSNDFDIYGTKTRELAGHIRENGLNAMHLYVGDWDPDINARRAGFDAQKIDFVIDEAARNGIYVVMCTGVNIDEPEDVEYVKQFWDFYSKRYKDKENVIFEMSNEHGWPDDGARIVADIYSIMRANAPDTMVLFFSFAVSVPPEALMPRIEETERLVDIPWTNEAVAFHAYEAIDAVYSGTWLHHVIDEFTGKGYPMINTEVPCRYSLTQYPDVGIYRVLEERGIGWTGFVNENLISYPAHWRGQFEAEGMVWPPDYGSWPVMDARYPFGVQSAAANVSQTTAAIVTDQGRSVLSMANGDSVTYSRLNFGTREPLSFRISVKSTSDGIITAKAGGTDLGSCNVTADDGYITFSGYIFSAVSGLPDVTFAFTGSGTAYLRDWQFVLPRQVSYTDPLKITEAANYPFREGGIVRRPSTDAGSAAKLQVGGITNGSALLFDFILFHDNEVVPFNIRAMPVAGGTVEVWAGDFDTYSC